MSGTELLHASKHGKAARMAARKAKKKSRHDEAWFLEQDNKYWGWGRIFCFWGAMLMMVLSIVAAGIMIYVMPRSANCRGQ
jgi:uncharacterized membrane protein YraQ (UPF0718 family)